MISIYGTFYYAEGFNLLQLFSIIMACIDFNIKGLYLTRYITLLSLLLNINTISAKK